MGRDLPEDRIKGSRSTAFRTLRGHPREGRYRARITGVRQCCQDQEAGVCQGSIDQGFQECRRRAVVLELTQPVQREAASLITELALRKFEQPREGLVPARVSAIPRCAAQDLAATVWI